MKFFILLFCCLFFGCSAHVPLTKKLIRDYDLTIQDVKQLQLYLSDGILLEQQIMTIDKNIDDKYALQKVEDHYIKQIYFKKDTPGIATLALPDKLRVSFEPCDELEFSINTKCKDGFFEYHPDKKERRDAESLGWQVVGEEWYCDSSFEAQVKDPGELPYIMVDKNDLKNIILNARTVQGMKQGLFR